MYKLIVDWRPLYTISTEPRVWLSTGSAVDLEVDVDETTVVYEFPEWGLASETLKAVSTILYVAWTPNQSPEEIEENGRLREYAEQWLQTVAKFEVN
jgi:hypothetical protein